MPPMNEQGARITAYGDLARQAVAGNYLVATRRLMMAKRKLQKMCDKPASECGEDLIYLDKVVRELSRREQEKRDAQV